MHADGYNVIMDEVKRSHDPHDPWGWCGGWMFALADYMWYWAGEIMPGYYPSPVRFDPELARKNSPELDILLDLDFEDDDARDVFMILHRYSTWLEIAGKNY